MRRSIWPEVTTDQAALCANHARAQRPHGRYRWTANRRSLSHCDGNGRKRNRPTGRGSRAIRICPSVNGLECFLPGRLATGLCVCTRQLAAPAVETGATAAFENW